MTIKHFEGTLRCPTDISEEAVRTVFAMEFVTFCRNFCTGIFQLERGEESGYLHFQIHLVWDKPLATKQSALKFFRNTPYSTIHLDPTSNVVVEELRTKQKTLEQLYSAKEETRVAGPWKIEKEQSTNVEYVPRQIREIEKLRPWQEWVVAEAQVWDTRHIHVIVAFQGNEGKSSLCGYMKCILKLKVFQLAVVKDHERLEADMCNQLSKADCRHPNAVLVDLPRSLPKDNMAGMFAAIENIKSGFIADTRNEHKEWRYDCPNIFVFTNVIPNISYLSQDRWVFHEIQGENIVHMSLDEAKVLYDSKKRKLGAS